MKQPDSLIYRHVTSVDPPGMLADLHCHNRFELIYVVSGEMAHVVEGRRYLLGPGDLVLVHPSKYHYLERLSTEPYERYNIQFVPQLHRVDVSFVPKELEVINLLSSPIAAALFPKMDYYKRELDTETFEKLLQQLLTELFINLRLVSDARKQEEVYLSPVLKRALEYINSNLYTISDVNEVADALYISSSYLFYLFRTFLHQTPKKYITDKRLLAAQRRIGRGMNPTAVYKECGFKEYTTFFRSYSAFFGHPPSQDSPHPDTTPL